MADENLIRYYLIKGLDGSWSVADWHITTTEPGHRMISGLSRQRADELLAELNSRRSGVPGLAAGIYSGSDLTTHSAAIGDAERLGLG
jgi:hypothetical protein